VHGGGAASHAAVPCCFHGGGGGGSSRRVAADFHGGGGVTVVCWPPLSHPSNKKAVRIAPAFCFCHRQVLERGEWPVAANPLQKHGVRQRFSLGELSFRRRSGSSSGHNSLVPLIGDSDFRSITAALPRQSQRIFVLWSAPAERERAPARMVSRLRPAPPLSFRCCRGSGPHWRNVPGMSAR